MGKNIELQLNQLTSQETGVLISEGSWKTKIVIEQDLSEYSKYSLKQDVKVIVEDTRYMLKSISLADTMIILEAQEIEKVTSSDNGMSSFYGAEAKMKYKDQSVKAMTCLEHSDGNLIIWFEDAKDIQKIEQIYINKVPILK